MPLTQRFQHMHVDIVGLLPYSKGYNYLFTTVDRFTHWPKAIPMTDMSTTSCVQAFLQGWVSRFGVPVRFTSDYGTQFTSKLWREMTCSLGIDIHQTTAYHPQSNGAVERLHRQLKASLIARLYTTSWLRNFRGYFLVCGWYPEMNSAPLWLN